MSRTLACLAFVLLVVVQCVVGQQCTSYSDCGSCTNINCFWCKTTNRCDTTFLTMQNCGNNLVQLPALCPATPGDDGGNNTPNPPSPNPLDGGRNPVAYAFIFIFPVILLLGIVFFVLRRRQVSGYVAHHLATKSGALDFSNLDSHTQSQIHNLVVQPDQLIWADVSHPVPSVGAVVFVSIVSAIGFILSFVISRTGPSPAWVICLVLAAFPVAYVIAFLIKVVTGNRVPSAVNGLSHGGATILSKSLFGSSTRKFFNFYQIRPQDVQVRSRCVPDGVGDLIFASEMKDVTEANRTHNAHHHHHNRHHHHHHHHDNALHVGKYENLDNVKEHIAEGTEVRQNGRVYKKTAVGFTNITRPNDVENMLRERITAIQMAPPAPAVIAVPYIVQQPVAYSPYPPPAAPPAGAYTSFPSPSAPAPNSGDNSFM